MSGIRGRHSEYHPAAENRDAERCECPATEAAFGPATAVALVDHLHDGLGNHYVSGALFEAYADPLAIVAAGDLQLALGGVFSCDSAFSSNTAMLRVLADGDSDAAIDWSDPNLARLGTPSGGRSLPPAVLDRFNAAFQHDFSKVRLHVDTGAAEAARLLRARAFALNADIFLGAGEFQPNSEQTDRLLAHELTHVVQYERGRLPSQTDGRRVSSPTDPAEREAYTQEDAVLARLDEFDAARAESASAGAGEEAAPAGGSLDPFDALAQSLGAEVYGVSA
ncbi:MAG: DUF4157 domain-containing protein, partial [Deltaproteobacteria bacterium]|nr:DUF4157 domain-containing protein [Deltaproteobacteria bacterium]